MIGSFPSKRTIINYIDNQNREFYWISRIFSVETLRISERAFEFEKMPQNTEAVAKEVARVNPEVGKINCPWVLSICVCIYICICQGVVCRAWRRGGWSSLHEEPDHPTEGTQWGHGQEPEGMLYHISCLVVLFCIKRALNQDLDKNLKVRCITYLVLTYHTVSKECSMRTWTRTWRYVVYRNRILRNVKVLIYYSPN